MLSKILKMSVVMTVMCLWRLYSEFEVIQDEGPCQVGFIH